MIDSQIISTKHFDASAFKISTVKTSNRKVDPELERKAKEEWVVIEKDAQDKGLNPWDGIYCRLENLDDVIKGSLDFKLGTVTYSQIRAFQKLKVSENFPIDYHTLHISTLGLLITSDGYMIFGYRERTMNNTNVTFIGGGLQPDEIEVSEGKDIERNMLKEISEEINVSKNEISKIEVVGMIHAIERMNIFIIFSVKLNLTKDEVHSQFEKIKNPEHDKLSFINESELETFEKELPLFMKQAISFKN